jgi:membrane-bound lytic murein transglycosylase D
LKIPVFVLINKVKAIRAGKGDDINSLAVKTGMSKASFMYFNELKGYESVAAGDFYYMQLKRSKALVAYHTVSKGETIHSIAQKYAVTTASIKKHNRLAKNEHVQENRILWLRSTRPKTTPVEYKTVTKPIVKEETKQTTAVNNPEPVEKTPVIVTPKYIDTHMTADAVYHIVQPGETVFGISRMYEVDSDSIREWNQLSGYAIQVNQKLIVAYKNQESKEIRTKEILYVVKAGDTVYKISKLYNVTVDEIKKWNNLPDYNLTLGQQLKIQMP